MTVNGMIQSVSGGFKFPNNTVQTTAGLSLIMHDGTLSGSGTGGSPLGIAVPLSLVGNLSTAILSVSNATSFAPAISAATYNGAAVSASSSASEGLSAISARGVGVYGTTSAGVGVYGETPDPLNAGYFQGNVSVNGTLTKSGGSFKIDHPLDPSNKYLSHSFVESPDMKNIYDGTVITDRTGNATVTLPDWFEALNRDFRYQLTVIGQFAQAIISSKISANQFSIRTDKPNVEVSWQVTGIRQDTWANAHRIPVEEEKPENERDSYLNPELFNQPAEKGVEWVRHPEMMKRHAQERAKMMNKIAQQQ
jgi:hypothetical protein